MTVLVLAARMLTLTPEREATWLADLPLQRRAQLCTWPDAKARALSLLGTRLLHEGLMRLGFGRALSLLGYSGRGKPAINLPVSFSLSHCDDLVLCGFSKEGPIGIDVERMGRLKASEFSLYLTQRERLWAGDDSERFYRLWTRKEAILKAADGNDLRLVRGIDAVETVVGFSGMPWVLADVRLDDGYVASMATARREPAEVEWISEDQLLRCH
jgi:4'-phosphopantetheinyl transferase